MLWSRNGKADSRSICLNSHLLEFILLYACVAHRKKFPLVGWHPVLGKAQANPSESRCAVNLALLLESS